MLATAPKPLIVMAPQESGFVTLRRANRVPDVPCTTPDTWTDLLALIRTLGDSEFDTIGFDAIGGFEHLCKAHVMQRDFDNQETKYQSFGRGNATLAAEWMVLLSALEGLAASKTVILASHVEISNFSNPDGENYSRFVGDTNKNVWAATKRWADAVLFGTFFSTVEDGKGHGGTTRIVYTEHRATHDAKNRYGMPPMIQIPDDPNAVYGSIFAHINKDSK